MSYCVRRPKTVFAPPTSSCRAEDVRTPTRDYSNGFWSEMAAGQQTPVQPYMFEPESDPEQEEAAEESQQPIDITFMLLLRRKFYGFTGRLPRVVTVLNPLLLARAVVHRPVRSNTISLS